MKFDAIKILKSQNAVVAVLVLALFAQMPHAASVFYRYSHTQNLWVALQSIGFAVALEVAVLVFVVRGSIQTSWGFAGFSIAVNAAYYSEGSLSVLSSVAAWPFWLLSAGLPVAIALYSHEVADKTAIAQVAQPEAQPPLRFVTDNMQVVAANMQIAAMGRKETAAGDCSTAIDSANTATDPAASLQGTASAGCSTAITERQSAILQMRSEGQTRKQIAALFGIALRTVDNEIKIARSVAG